MEHIGKLDIGVNMNKKIILILCVYLVFVLGSASVDVWRLIKIKRTNYSTPFYNSNFHRNPILNTITFFHDSNYILKYGDNGNIWYCKETYINGKKYWTIIDEYQKNTVKNLLVNKN